MKKLLIILMVTLMLCGCTGTANEGSGTPKEEEKVYTLEDGIIPYLAHSTINIVYSVIVERDQSSDYTVSRLVRLVPLKEEGEFYETMKQQFSEEQLDGELYFVSEMIESDRHLQYDQMDLEKNYLNYFWVMKDDPEAKVLTIHQYSSDRETVYDQQKQDWVPGNLSFEMDYGNDRYVIDYSKMEEDDWDLLATESFAYSDSFASRPYDYKGYVTVYDPVKGIPEYTYIALVENGVRMRSTPEIRDDNKLGVLKAYSTNDFWFRFFLYEKTENDGYTWYRVGKKHWIASDGTWVEEHQLKAEG
ncbi:MAG: hypothetical protein IJI44_06605 [Erysipelotrichaceae bacterium]|nr:hypothetical protein [Erysipelotrichaceae bacterium]